MLAEFDVEIGGDAPTLAVPWSSGDGSSSFVDLSENLALIDQIPETRDSAWREALLQLNAPASHYMTAKCDLWTTQELSGEEEIFEARWKHGSYLDLLRRELEERREFAPCELAMRRWVRELRSLEPDNASVAIVLRACEVWGHPGHYWTLFISGYGETGIAAHEAWSAALDAVMRTLLSC